MTTEKLYWDDPLAARFTASRLSFGRAADTEGRELPSVILERTLFYPEGGGQLGDRGTLSVQTSAGERTVDVADVQIDDSGVIHHLVSEEAAQALGAALGASSAKTWEAEIAGAIDPVRRADHRAHHTAQHMVSRGLVDVARADTVSARLGAGECTIDADIGTLTDAAVARVEDLVNAVVRDDVEVRAHFPTDAELAKMPLRRAPKVAQGIRVIEVAGFDFTPCGGTHATRTGQLGLVRVVRLERIKGKMRVYFQAAQRALDATRERDRALFALARDFTCGPLDVAAGVAKLRAELKGRMDALGVARGELVALIAAERLASIAPDAQGPSLLAMERTGFDVSTLRALAGRLTGRAGIVALCAAAETPGADLAVVVQRSADVTFDCGAWLKGEAARLGGRGGGSKERAEGRFPAGTVVGELAKSVGLPEPGGAPSLAAGPPAERDADGKRPGDG